VTPRIPSESDVIPDVETSQDQLVNVVETGFEIPQTDADMVEFLENLQPDSG